MFRQSIYENKDRYKEAVIKVLNLKEQGFKEEEIPQNLSPFFQEKEIISLIDDFKKLPTLDGNQELKSLLKIHYGYYYFSRFFLSLHF